MAFQGASGGPAWAQAVHWDWGGERKVNDSGRQRVRLNVDRKPGEVIVSFADRRLYLVTRPGEALSYPIAVPREKSRWQGNTIISAKRVNPSWTPTTDMLRENARLPRWVPGGHPMNPLGNRALYLGASEYRIHGTDAPWTIGTAASKGCVRMYNSDVADLFERVSAGAKVFVTWQAYEAKPLPAGDEPMLTGGPQPRSASVAARAIAPATRTAPARAAPRNPASGERRNGAEKAPAAGSAGAIDSPAKAPAPAVRSRPKPAVAEVLDI
jgi:hypothetical protein